MAFSFCKNYPPFSAQNVLLTKINPPCPYSGEIPGGLQNGTIITVQGVTPMNQNQFSVNLCVSSGVEPLSDTAIHVNPRYDEKCLVLNSLIRNSWGTEVRSKNLPLTKGEPFEMIILVDSNGFKIALNGQHFAVFDHRLLKGCARFLIIKGGIQMNFIRICGSFVPPPLPTSGEYPMIYNPMEGAGSHFRHQWTSDITQAVIQARERVYNVHPILLMLRKIF